VGAGCGGGKSRWGVCFGWGVPVAAAWVSGSVVGAGPRGVEVVCRPSARVGSEQVAVGWAWLD